jgi:hypothetical protein
MNRQIDLDSYGSNTYNSTHVYFFLWTFPSSGILETRTHDVSETGSVSVLR